MYGRYTTLKHQYWVRAILGRFPPPQILSETWTHPPTSLVNPDFFYLALVLISMQVGQDELNQMMVDDVDGLVTAVNSATCANINGHQVIILAADGTVTCECQSIISAFNNLIIIELAVCVAVCVCGSRLLERLMSPSPKPQVMFASAFS